MEQMELFVLSKGGIYKKGPKMFSPIWGILEW